jgi:hypothetical protein
MQQRITWQQLLLVIGAAEAAPLSAAADITPVVVHSDGSQLAILEAGFVSFNIDFDNRPRQLQAGFYSVNFSDTRLVAAAAALAPAALRIGGGDEDKQVYGVGDFAPSNCSEVYDPWTVRNSSAINCRKVTPQRYAALYQFAQAAGLRLIFAFNPFYGYCCHSACLGHCDLLAQTRMEQLPRVDVIPNRPRQAHPPPPPGCRGPCKSWDSSNTEAMLRHMKATAQVPWAVQLGNEQGNGIAPYDGVTTAHSFMRLDDMIRAIWPSGGGPRVMGPDAGGGQYLRDFWDTLQRADRTRLLDAFTYHSYGAGHMAATNGGTGELGLRNASVLDWYGAAEYNQVVKPVHEFNVPSSQQETWIGEVRCPRTTAGFFRDSFVLFELYACADGLACRRWYTWCL